MYFTEEHLWLREEDDEMLVGLTQYGLLQLGTVTFIELPEEGMTISKDDEVAVLEGDDETIDVLAPADGEVIEVNPALEDSPDKINDDPQGDGWLFKMVLSDEDPLDDLMDEAAYQAYIR